MIARRAACRAPFVCRRPSFFRGEEEEVSLSQRSPPFHTSIVRSVGLSSPFLPLRDSLSVSSLWPPRCGPGERAGACACGPVSRQLSRRASRPHLPIPSAPATVNSERPLSLARALSLFRCHACGHAEDGGGPISGAARPPTAAGGLGERWYPRRPPRRLLSVLPRPLPASNTPLRLNGRRGDRPSDRPTPLSPPFAVFVPRCGLRQRGRQAGRQAGRQGERLNGREAGGLAGWGGGRQLSMACLECR